MEKRVVKASVGLMWLLFDSTLSSSSCGFSSGGSLLVYSRLLSALASSPSTDVYKWLFCYSLGFFLSVFVLGFVSLPAGVGESVWPLPSFKLKFKPKPQHSLLNTVSYSKPWRCAITLVWVTCNQVSHGRDYHSGPLENSIFSPLLGP